MSNINEFAFEFLSVKLSWVMLGSDNFYAYLVYYHMSRCIQLPYCSSWHPRWTSLTSLQWRLKKPFLSCSSYRNSIRIFHVLFWYIHFSFPPPCDSQFVSLSAILFISVRNFNLFTVKIYLGTSGSNLELYSTISVSWVPFPLLCLEDVRCVSLNNDRLFRSAFPAHL